MDPITLMAAATAAFEGVKKAVEIGREVQDVYQQLSVWAGHVGDLKDVIEVRENKKPGLWDKITFDKSDTAEAFDMYAAKQKLQEMEKEIFHMFLYGDLCHLGIDGYREFKKMRDEVREKRKKLIFDQLQARKDFFNNIKNLIFISLVLIAGTAILFGLISFAIDMAEQAGRL